MKIINLSKSKRKTFRTGRRTLVPIKTLSLYRPYIIQDESILISDEKCGITMDSTFRFSLDERTQYKMSMRDYFDDHVNSIDYMVRTILIRQYGKN